MASRGFPTVFAEERAAILSVLCSMSSVSKDKVVAELDSLQQRLVQLNVEYTQNASSLPTYEQRRCQEQLKQLTELLSAEKLKHVPKQKFSFKSRGKSESPTTSTPVTTPITPEPLNTIPDNGITFSKSNVCLATSPDIHVSNIRLISMSNSVINLLYPRRHATLQVKELSRCLILASSFDGAAHLTNVNNCIVVLKCHQFRMHDSRNTSVYLSCSSRPIIENSSEIGFAEYPAMVRKRTGMTSSEKEDWMVKELVEDFNWLRREHSPNWRIIQDGISGDIWDEIMELVGQHSPSAERILDLVMR